MGMARTAVVSGGATGIGRAVARAFSVAGERVVILGRRAELLERAAAELNAEVGAGRVSWHTADLTRPDQVAAAATAIGGAAGQVNVIVNNAGGNVGRDVAGSLRKAGCRRGAAWFPLSLARHVTR